MDGLKDLYAKAKTQIPKIKAAFPNAYFNEFMKELKEELTGITTWELIYQSPCWRQTFRTPEKALSPKQAVKNPTNSFMIADELGMEARRCGS